MDKVQLIITLISSIMVLLGALTGFIISLIKAIKSKKLAVNKLCVLDFWMDIAKDVENMTFMNNDEREKFITNKFSDFSSANDLKFDAEEVTKAIKGIIEFAKKI